MTEMNSALKCKTQTPWKLSHEITKKNIEELEKEVILEKRSVMKAEEAIKQLY